MAWTQTDIDNLRQAMASGAKRVRFGSGDSAQETEFRSLADMRSLLGEMEAEVNGAMTGRPIITVAEHRRD